MLILGYFQVFYALACSLLFFVAFLINAFENRIPCQIHCSGLLRLVWRLNCLTTILLLGIATLKTDNLAL